MKFSVKDFFNKCDQIRRKLLIWSRLLKKTSFFAQWKYIFRIKRCIHNENTTLMCLTHLKLMFHFYIPEKTSENQKFLTFSLGIEIEHWSHQRCSRSLSKKRLWHKCFLVNIAKFLRAPFLQNNSGWLLLAKCIQNWQKGDQNEANYDIILEYLLLKIKAL